MNDDLFSAGNEDKKHVNPEITKKNHSYLVSNPHLRHLDLKILKI